jgi:predicted MFS family arabinose efflux permease
VDGAGTGLLRDRRLATLLVAEVISSTGTQMTWVAIPWFVLRTTGSPQRMTWVLIAEILPVSLTGFWGGAIAGRIGTRRTMLISDLLRVPLFAAIPLLHSLGQLSFPVLLILVAASGVFLSPYLTVQRTVVPELVGEEQGDVATATAFFQAANRATIFAGPTLAGILIGFIGAADVLYVDAATYFVSFVLVGLFVHPPAVEAPKDRHGALAGLRFIRRDSLLRVWVPALTMVDICWTAFFACLPVLVVERYGANPRVVGLLIGGLGAGALVGAFVALRFVRQAEPLRMTAVCFLCQVASLWSVAAPVPWPVAVGGMAASGFFMSLVNSPMQALIMLRVPRELRTQTMAVSAVTMCAGAPLGLIATGWGLTHLSPRLVIGTVLALQTTAILAVVGGAVAERAALGVTESPA